MDSKALCFLSLSEASRLIRERKISSAELTRCVLDRIRLLDPRLHAYLTVLDDSAMSSAERADKEIASGDWRGPLHGVPVAVKDLCSTKGVLTTCASKVLANWRPDSNATVVDRLESAGAVMLGKLNLTEFAVGWYHPEFPTPVNPWGAEYWVGASSSGSGVAAAAGLCFAAIGTDTGGSIRLPSAACGVVGLKPTWGRVSRHGVFPLSESLDHIGPMARRVGDAAMLLQVIAGYDAADETSLFTPVENYTDGLGRGVSGIRVGIDEAYIAAGASSELASAVIDAARTLERLGARIVKVTIPDVQPALAAWITLNTAEAAAAHETTYPARAAEYGPGIRSVLELGTKVRGQDYAKAHIIRERFANRIRGVFDQVHALACPSASFVSLPVSAMPSDAKVLFDSTPLQKSLAYTAPFDMSRNPTLS
jgi:amidase